MGGNPGIMNSGGGSMPSAPQMPAAPGPSALPAFGSLAPLAGMFGSNQSGFGAMQSGTGSMPPPDRLLTQPQPNPNPAWEDLSNTPATPPPAAAPAPAMAAGRPAFVDAYLNSGRPDQEAAALRYMRDLKAGTAPAAPSIMAPAGYQAMGGRRGGGRGG